MNKKIIKISIFILVVDQLLKILVNMFLDKPVIIINNFFSLEKAYNTGVAFSFLSGNRLLIIVINLLIFYVLVSLIKTFKENTRNMIAFSLIIGGLLGNLLDRIMYGHVVDYLRFDFGTYTYPIFNLADSCVVIGVILLAYAVYKKEDENGSNNK